MKIIQLTAENVKKLTAVEIRPDGNVVQITGKNGQGKTSVLDAIWWALSGTENVQSKPIRNGAENARIELQLGSGEKVELVVERKFTDKASYLNVKTADGAKYPSPQKLLDDLLGALTFDPLQFMRETSKGQFEILRGMVKLDIDPDEIDKQNKADYDERTLINREAKAKRAQADAIDIPSGLPEERVDEAKLLDSIQAGADVNASIEKMKGEAQRVAGKIQSLRDNAKSLRADAAELRLEADGKDARADEVEAEAETLEAEFMNSEAPPDPVDLSKLREDLENAQLVNEAIEARERKAALAKEAKSLEDQSNKLTKAIEARNAAKQKAIEKADMPVEGLSFGDGAVIFNEVPLDQASDAEQLMISTAIAAALNPKLRVLRIRDGSLLDEDAMKRLADFAEERDFQIWIERVDGSGVVGVVMEDGHVKGAEPAAKEAAE